MASLGKSMKSLRKSMESLRKSMESLRESMASLRKSMDSLRKSMESLRKSTKSLRTSIESLRKSMEPEGNQWNPQWNPGRLDTLATLSKTVVWGTPATHLSEFGPTGRMDCVSRPLNRHLSARIMQSSSSKTPGCENLGAERL